MKASTDAGSLYRARLIGRDGAIAKTFGLMVIDRRDAIAQVKRYTGGFTLEIWDGDRVVARTPRTAT